MTSLDSGLASLPPGPASRPVFGQVQWAPVMAGAIAAAALAFVLHSVAGGIGLSIASAAPSWRDASFALVLLSALYLVLTAVAAYGFGGYVSGLLREPTTAAADEVEFRDGMHGLLVWALATLLTAVFAFAAAQSVTRLAAPAGGVVRQGRQHRSAARTSSPLISIACFAPNDRWKGTRTTTELRSCSLPPAIAACCRRIAPSWWDLWRRERD